MIDVTRDVSFRGRRNFAYAHWSKKGIRNVVTFNLNVIWKDVKEMPLKVRESYFAHVFTILDFHEWLHLFIRRESGCRNTYFVTDDCHRFIYDAQYFLDEILLTDPERIFPGTGRIWDDLDRKVESYCDRPERGMAGFSSVIFDEVKGGEQVSCRKCGGTGVLFFMHRGYHTVALPVKSALKYRGKGYECNSDVECPRCNGRGYRYIERESMGSKVPLPVALTVAEEVAL